MFRIGDFARLTRVSVKMLRNYDELGLLKPAMVDPESGYRYYSADQLPRLNRIIALKDLGFALDQIGELLADDLSQEELRGILKLRRSEITARIRVEQGRLALVDAHLRQLNKAAPPDVHAVIVRAIPAQLVAGMHAQVEDAQTIQRLFEHVEAYVASHRARSVSSPLCLFADRELGEDQTSVTVAVPLAAQIPPGAGVEVWELPAVPAMACCVYTGSYDRSTTALQALLGWVEAHSCTINGPLREVYLQFGADNAAELGLPPAFLVDRPEDYVTEVQLSVELP
jgi:DNA-binding transcriptional MerR regulator